MVIVFENVTNVFGPSPNDALERLGRGHSRDDILEQTGNLVATQDVSLQVRSGEILVLMGLSGSGKSTLLRCANALVRPARGRVLVNENGGATDLSRADAATLRRIRQRRISMVFQRFALLPWRTLRGNVAFGLEVRGLPWEQTLEIVDQMLELVGLSGWKDKMPHELSGGMQQRVGLARALATNADLLLLDEPFSALDPLIRNRMQGELLALQRDLKKTMLFVTHDLDEALKLGTRVAIMEAGRVIQIGTPEEIVTHPATDYVRKFVSHVNPLNVLRGGSLMRPLASLARAPEETSVVLLDDAGITRCRIDDAGRMTHAWIGDSKATVIAYDGGTNGTPAGAGTLFSCGQDAAIRVAIDAIHRTGQPLLLVTPDGRLVGIVAGREVLKGLSSPAASVTA
ncbi:MAG: ATP-binding cassette domain-containing protein [Candidatus Wallbacteria bacterium]|nr:ATP-binding cassette domain-containing protein [Candidatus Wallbacteria bacterium]